MLARIVTAQAPPDCLYMAIFQVIGMMRRNVTYFHCLQAMWSNMVACLWPNTS